ncbi:MAG: RHS repeat-associated core domain-containing protein, partial [Chloroflexota bacterium]
MTTQQRYLPFGAVRADAGAITQTDFGYTFQRNLPEAGLMDYDARFYLPALGRFSQPDTLVPGAGNPQNLNRFSYVRNNPLRYADPTGHWAPETDDPVKELR